MKHLLRIISIAFIICLSYHSVSSGAVEGDFSIVTYGAKGDSKTDNAAAIQKAIDVCSAAGGGRVVVPAGKTFLTGPFQLKSFVELYIATNAKLLANPNEAVYKESAFGENKGEGTLWISARDVENVTISGQGTIDGNGISFMGPEQEDAYVLKPFHILDPRPHLLTIIGGKNIRIHQLTIRNSAYWTVHLIGCNDVAISDLTLLNSLKVRNSDGIDIDHSKNVRVTNCYIESGDDCICLKNRREFEQYGVCEHITVSNCTMTSRSCAVKIGSENMDTIRNVVFNNCIITKSNRGIGIQNRDEGVVTNVIFSNFIINAHLFSDVWWGKAEPMYVTAYRRAKTNDKDANWRFPKGAAEGRVGLVSDIWFSNIKAQSENGVYVSAGEADKLSGIHFSNIDLQIEKTTNIPGGVYDRRPANVDGIVKDKTSGFYLENALSVYIQSCSVIWGANKATWFGYVLRSNNVQDLKVKQLTGTSATGNAPFIINNRAGGNDFLTK